MKVGRYVVISELGRGAMGIVYKASDPTIDRQVALKVVSLSASPGDGSESPRQMFMREVRAAGRLSHSSIVTIHDAFDDKETQTSCIVMELVPGMTLEKILEAGHTLAVEQTLSLVRQVAEGLDYAHRNQVIHRDLKPANILVTEDGRAKITDFGIAKVLAREGAARTVGVMGTPSYMSPEQVRGSDVDARTDIFSLGIILFTMLAGKKPFVGNTAAVMFKIVYEEPAAPSTFNPQLTPAHDYVVAKCLAKDRKNRYSAARELVADLDDLQNGRPPRSQAAAVPATPSSVSSTSPTVAKTLPGMIKTTAPRPAPPARTPVAPAKTGGPVAPGPSGRTAATPVSGPPKVASAPPAPRPAPHQHPPAPPPNPTSANPATAVTPPTTMALPISELMKAASQHPAKRSAPAPAAASSVPAPAPKPNVPSPVSALPPGLPLTEHTLPMHVPDLSAVSSPVPPLRQSPPKPPVDDQSLMERTLPMRVPDLSALSSSPLPPTSRTPPTSVVPADSSLLEVTLPTQAPDLTSLPPAAGGQTPGTAVPLPSIARPTVSRVPEAQATRVTTPPPIDVARPEEPTLVSGAAPASKSKLVPALLGVVAVALLIGAIWGFWKFHQGRVATPPASQVRAQTWAAPPNPEPAPATASIPPPAPAVEQAPPPKGAAPQVTKKIAAHKPKPAAVAQPTVPEPGPAPPQPAAVTPVPAPAAPTPGPEAIAKAEAAKFANVPHIIQVSCNFDLKEATFTFSSGGKTLFADTFKGKKKKKDGFLGLKGSYQGTFSHTLTVPAGASEVSLHIVAKDGATDLNQAIKMPTPGGFIPTLTVTVDSEHLSLNWKGSSQSF